MKLHSRRQFMAACACCTLSSKAWAFESKQIGCLASGGEPPDGFAEGLLDAGFDSGTTGNPELDGSLGKALTLMAGFFDVQPGVGL